MKKHLVVVLATILACGIAGCKRRADSKQAHAPEVSQKEPSPLITATATTETNKTALSTNSARKVLVFRNVRSWGREIDFEEVLTELAFDFEQKASDEMESSDLSPYRFVVIPGAQWRTDFYRDYADNAARFESYVTNGGVLVLELNGAERDGITLPGGVTMVSHGSLDNVIIVPDHPVLAPFGGRRIRANAASHGYLAGVPKNASILVTEAENDQPAMDKPTFIEYPYGKGRVIAACQCFHDRDGSGRGPLMPTLLSYAAEKQWHTPTKAK